MHKNSYTSETYHVYNVYTLQQRQSNNRPIRIKKRFLRLQGIQESVNYEIILNLLAAAVVDISTIQEAQNI